MSDPPSFDPTGAPDPDRLGGDLLASARGDAPSPAARARVAGALGIGVGAVATVATTKAAAAATASKAAKAAGIGLWTKVAGIAAVTIAVGGGAIVATQPDAPTPVAPAPSASASAAPAQRGMSSGERARLEQIPAPEPVAAEPAVTATASSEPVASAPPVAKLSGRIENGDDGPSLLSREVRAIDSARGALARGDANAALAALDQHDRDFPNGPMRTEADVLRVDALVAKGDHPGAQKLAARLLAREPAGAHARHLRSVSEEPQK